MEAAGWHGDALLWAGGYCGQRMKMAFDPMKALRRSLPEVSSCHGGES